METRSNHVLVGSVVLAIIALGVLFVVWMAQIGSGHQQRYDIFFPNSVSGLAKGSAVTFSGVPVGKIDDIKLLPDRHRTCGCASRSTMRRRSCRAPPRRSPASASPASARSIWAARRKVPPITEIGPFGVPVIPTKAGMLGQLLNSARS